VLETEKFFREIVEWADPAAGSSLLDLSCGQGVFLKTAAHCRPGLRLHGLDLSRKAIATAGLLVPGAALKTGDALRTGYPGRAFDTITCLGALEHYPDSSRGLAEIHRILKDGGRAVIYVPNLFFIGYIYLVWLTGEPPHEAGQNEYEHFETRKGWENMIRSRGFRILGTRKYNDMYATERVGGLVKALYQGLIKPFIPLNLSYCFAFLVEKDPAWKPGGNLNG
jgi:2-polyprenyl-3-methyl-5-hydroxy-6-metoxy-1,4-benzoquinol methylase